MLLTLQGTEGNEIVKSINKYTDVAIDTLELADSLIIGTKRYLIMKNIINFLSSNILQPIIYAIKIKVNPKLVKVIVTATLLFIFPTHVISAYAIKYVSTNVIAPIISKKLDYHLPRAKRAMVESFSEIMNYNTDKTVITLSQQLMNITIIYIDLLLKFNSDNNPLNLLNIEINDKSFNKSQLKILNYMKENALDSKDIKNIAIWFLTTLDFNKLVLSRKYDELKILAIVLRDKVFHLCDKLDESVKKYIDNKDGKIINNYLDGLIMLEIHHLRRLLLPPSHEDIDHPLYKISDQKDVLEDDAEIDDDVFNSISDCFLKAYDNISTKHTDTVISRNDPNIGISIETKMSTFDLPSLVEYASEYLLPSDIEKIINHNTSTISVFSKLIEYYHNSLCMLDTISNVDAKHFLHGELEYRFKLQTSDLEDIPFETELDLILDEETEDDEQPIFVLDEQLKEGIREVFKTLRPAPGSTFLSFSDTIVTGVQQSITYINLSDLDKIPFRNNCIMMCILIIIFRAINITSRGARLGLLIAQDGEDRKPSQYDENYLTEFTCQAMTIKLILMMVY